MKIIICVLLLSLICAVQEATVVLLELRSNVQMVQAKADGALAAAVKMKAMAEWFDNVPLSNKVRMVSQ